MSIYFRPSLPAAAGSAAAPSIAFIGDPNTGVYSPGADQVAISTNGTGRLFVDASGKVGINKSPARDFTVYGSSSGLSYLQLAHSAASGASRGFEIVLNATESYFINRESGSTIFVNGGNERMRLTSTGALGLGTTAPSELLEASGGNISIYHPSTGNGAGYSLLFKSNGGSTGATLAQIVASQSGTNVNTANLRFLVANAGSLGEAARITSDGKLLVGTSTGSGDALLQVNGDRVRIATAKTPASATDTGTTGEVCWDANYVYVCVATNTWKRSAISTW